MANGVQEYDKQKNMKKVLKVLLWVIGIIALLLVVALIMLRVASPGKLPELKDDQGEVIPGSLSERGFLTIGGLEQGFFIRGENQENPVILYLHGGPGSPELPLIMATEQQERPEKYFTVC